jgi:hypothetical protein
LKPLRRLSHAFFLSNGCKDMQLMQGIRHILMFIYQYEYINFCLYMERHFTYATFSPKTRT